MSAGNSKLKKPPFCKSFFRLARLVLFNASTRNVCLWRLSFFKWLGLILRLALSTFLIHSHTFETHSLLHVLKKCLRSLKLRRLILTSSLWMSLNRLLMSCSFTRYLTNDNSLLYVSLNRTICKELSKSSSFANLVFLVFSCETWYDLY